MVLVLVLHVLGSARFIPEWREGAAWLTGVLTVLGSVCDGGDGGTRLGLVAADEVLSASLGKEGTRLLLLRGMFRGATSGVSRTGATRVVRPLAPCQAGRLDVKAPAAGSVDEMKSLGGAGAGTEDDTGDNARTGVRAGDEGTGRDVRGAAGDRGANAAGCCEGCVEGSAVEVGEAAEAPLPTPFTVLRSRLAKLAIPFAAVAALPSLTGASVGLTTSALGSARPRAYSAGLTWLGRPFCELVSSPVRGSQRTSPPLYPRFDEAMELARSCASCSCCRRSLDLVSRSVFAEASAV